MLYNDRPAHVCETGAEIQLLVSAITVTETETSC